MSTRHPQLSTLFERALETPAAQRAEFLAAACAGDAALRDELESLLDAHDSSNGYFEKLAEQLGVPALVNKFSSYAASSSDVPAIISYARNSPFGSTVATVRR